MKAMKAMCKTMEACAKKLNEALSRATEANFEVISDLEKSFRAEYEAELAERGLEPNPRMPELGGNEEGMIFEGNEPGYIIPRWHYAEVEADGSIGHIMYPIDAASECGDHTFDELERELPYLKAWELLLIWEYELRLRPFRASIRSVSDVISKLADLSQYRLVDNVPPVDNERLMRPSSHGAVR